MRSVNECFDNVKEDYFKFLNKEKILGKSKAEKIKSLKKIYIHISFWIENKYRKSEKSNSSQNLQFSWPRGPILWETASYM